MSDAAAAPSRWYRIGSPEEFCEDEPVLRSIGGIDIAIVRVGGVLFALDDRCPHGDASLSEGWIEGHCLVCPLHQALFNLTSGEPEAGPATEPVRAYSIREDVADIFIEI